MTTEETIEHILHSKKPIFEIITRCTRPENLEKVKASIDIANVNNKVKIKWSIIVDISACKTISTNILEKYSNEIFFWKGIPDDMGHSLLNKLIYSIQNDHWIYILDDDNEMHPDFINVLFNEIENNLLIEGYIFSQCVNGKDFTGLEIREAKEENIAVSKIDMAQFCLRKSLISEKQFITNTYTADGIFIEELYHNNKIKFKILTQVLCNYNSLKEVWKFRYTLPRVLILNENLENNSILTSNKNFEYEENKLNCEFSNNENALIDIAKFDPDAIISVGSNYSKFNNLQNASLDIRRRWIHSDSEANGECSYNCGMNYILSNDYSHIISIFTPVYNTGNKILRTYKSILENSYTNWEWIVTNDSTDNITLSILEDIAKKDPRVKIYDFNTKSKGIIGESKYRACVLSKGEYLIELDHDDVLLPHALQMVYNAFQKYSDSGFVYSHCSEIDENYNSLTYGDTFAFGYGYYRTDNFYNTEFQTAVTPNINPLTIRHIISSPNHLRAWRRNLYFKIGGHNRRLSIADDYELIVRTFLKTKFTKIDQNCYFQFYHNDNAQNSTRADIQRRVRSISLFYNEQIKNRFEELGKIDWAYRENTLAWNTDPHYGKDENFVNYVL